MICTVSTVKDSVRNVTSFVERNLAAGADHMFVFVEGGDQGVVAYLEEHAHVTVVDSDATDRHNPQPSNLNTRQTINANRVNALLAELGCADWLFHIDGDEVLDIDKERLLALGPEVETVRLVPKESVSSAQPEHEGYFKRLLTKEELALLTVLGLLTRASNRVYFHGHVLGKVGIRPSLRYGMHIHQARVLGEEEPAEDFRADWLSLLHYESFTLEEFVRKWIVHLQAGPQTKFRGEKELVRGAVSGVLGSAHLDEEQKRWYLGEIYRRRIEDDVPSLLQLGLLVTVDRRGHRPERFTRQQEESITRLLPEILHADLDYFLPRKLEHDPEQLMHTCHGGARHRGWTISP